MTSDPIESAVVAWFGRDSDGEWWYSIVGERFGSFQRQSGIECKMDAVEGLVAAFRAAMLDRINAKIPEARDAMEAACLESMRKEGER